MTIRVRPFSPADVAAVVDIYNQARPIEVAQLSEDRFWGWFADPALDPARDVLVAADEEGPLGIIASFPWPNHLALGYVFFVGPSVLPEFQAKGVGRMLVDALAADVAARHPGTRLQTRLNQANGKAHAFLTEHLGFSVERQFWQMNHPAPGKVQPGPAPMGYLFGYLEPGAEADEVVGVYEQILNDPVAGRHLLQPEELQRWASLGTFGANSFQVARQDGQVVGLCFEAYPPGADHAQVEFLGVLPAHRGQGLALHFLQTALANAHAAGKTGVRLEVTGGDEGPALALYRKLGFEVTGGEVFYQRQARQPASQP
jgi:ribosomal protein S18 acetylase RimI-like enzyme